MFAVGAMPVAQGGGMNVRTHTWRLLYTRRRYASVNVVVMAEQQTTQKGRNLAPHVMPGCLQGAYRTFPAGPTRMRARHVQLLKLILPVSPCPALSLHV